MSIEQGGSKKQKQVQVCTYGSSLLMHDTSFSTGLFWGTDKMMCLMCVFVLL